MSVVFLHFVDMFYPYDLMYRRTPLQNTLFALSAPFYRGNEAVLLFFVLSGFVLALPYLRGTSQPYIPFVLRRIARIYLPYLAGLALAVLGAFLWHGHLYLGDWAEVSWTKAPDWRSVLSHVLFIGNYNWFLYNRVFWSLIVEMRVSLVFPLLIAILMRLRLMYSLGLASGFVILFRALSKFHPNGGRSLETVVYVAVFILGIVIAQHLAAVDRWYERRTRLERFLICGTVVLGYFGGHLLPQMSKLAILYGAVGAVILAMNSAIFRGILGHTVVKFLGKISYSLYLVHLPILYILAFTLHTKIRYTVLFVVYIAVSLTVATFFFTIIEAPCIELSRWIGRSLTPRNDRAPFRITSTDVGDGADPIQKSKLQDSATLRH